MRQYQYLYLAPSHGHILYFSALTETSYFFSTVCWKMCFTVACQNLLWLALLKKLASWRGTNISIRGWGHQHKRSTSVKSILILQ